MELDALNLDQIYCHVKDYLGQLHQPHTWAAEKIVAKNIVVIRNVAASTSSVYTELKASLTQTLPPSDATQSDQARIELPNVIKLEEKEEESWISDLPLYWLNDVEAEILGDSVYLPSSENLTIRRESITEGQQHGEHGVHSEKREYGGRKGQEEAQRSEREQKEKEGLKNEELCEGKEMEVQDDKHVFPDQNTESQNIECRNEGEKDDMDEGRQEDEASGEREHEQKIYIILHRHDLSDSYLNVGDSETLSHGTSASRATERKNQDRSLIVDGKKMSNSNTQAKKRKSSSATCQELANPKLSDDGRLHCPRCAITLKNRNNLFKHFRLIHRGKEYPATNEADAPEEPAEKVCDNTERDLMGYGIMDGGKKDGEDDIKSSSFVSRPTKYSELACVKISDNGRLHCPRCSSTYLNSHGLRKHYRSEHHSQDYDVSSKPNNEQNPNGTDCGENAPVADIADHCDVAETDDFLENATTDDGREDSQKVVYFNPLEYQELPKMKSSDTGSFHCPRCSSKFKCRSNLRKHCKRVHLAQFFAKGTLSKYPELSKVKKAKDGRLQCPRCPLTHRSGMQLMNHFRIAHCKQSDNATKIKVARRSFASLAFIKTEGGLLHCPKCPLIFKTRSSLGNHFGEVHDGHYKCPVCHVKFLKRSAARFHREMIHNDGSGNLLCHFCDMKFYHDSYLKRHIQICHGKGIYCEHCNIKFPSYWTQICLTQERSILL